MFDSTEVIQVIRKEAPTVRYVSVVRDLTWYGPHRGDELASHYRIAVQPGFDGTGCQSFDNANLQDALMAVLKAITEFRLKSEAYVASVEQEKLTPTAQEVAQAEAEASAS